MRRAKLSVPSGPGSKEIGGDIPSPSQVCPTGMCSPSPNARLLTSNDAGDGSSAQAAASNAIVSPIAIFETLPPLGIGSHSPVLW